MTASQAPPRRFMGVGTLALVSISAVISLRNWPMMALEGWHSTFFYLCSGVFFLIPVSLACAELAATWPEQGGVYLWVRKAFGPPTGVLAIWLEWMESVIWLPVVLSFLAGLVAYIINPILVHDRYFMLITILTALWGLTFLNFLNIKLSARFSAVGITLGTLLPGSLIIALGLYWCASGQPTAISVTPDAFFPEANMAHFVFFSGLLLSFAGVEVAAFYIQDVANPQKTFPLATFLAVVLILTLSVLGTLSIAWVIPSAEIELASGTMQAFQVFFTALGMPQLVPAIAALALLGALALVNTWIIGPSRGLLLPAKEGYMPKMFAYSNKHHSPTHILYAQAIISTVLTCAFVFMPSVNASYWLLTVLAAQLMALMYALLFLSVIRLRYTQPHTPRAFAIPGGTPGLWLVAGTGFCASMMAFLVGFFPPHGIDVGDPLHYSLFLLLAVIVSSFPPFLWLFPHRTLQR